jgi:hypothetical protein
MDVDTPALVIGIIFAALGLFSAIARVTPNESDNKWADKAWKFVNNLGLRGGPTE